MYETAKFVRSIERGKILFADFRLSLLVDRVVDESLSRLSSPTLAAAAGR